MNISTSEPESRPEIIGARKERRMGRRVNNETNRSVVSERHEMQARRIARIPRAQRSGCLVRKQNIVFGVVEHGLGIMLLFAGRSGAGVRNQTATGA